MGTISTTTPFRWGILGTGTIAGKFATGLAAVGGDAELAAVGSRTAAGARAFADRHGVARAHGSYAALAADPDVDCVYVASPHSAHREHTLLCIEHGKHVLCEKPFALSEAEGREMVAAARDRGVFLMEAMWTRFNPVMVRLRELLREGVLGELRYLQADFGFRVPFDADGRLFAPALGGGALLDVGVYGVSLAHMVFGGPPEAIAGLADLGRTGIDEQSAWVCRWPDGRLAVLSAAVRTETPQEAVLCGTDDRVRIPGFWHPDRLFVGGREETFEIAGNGYHYQAEEVARCVREGRTESAVMPLDETLAILADLDRIRAQWGLRYPGEGE